VGGMAYLFLDMVDPSQSKFPAYELWESSSFGRDDRYITKAVSL
jgi:hypothetical protein